MASILSNLQLLLNVPSFCRWPLTLHFFAKEVHSAWLAAVAASAKPLRKALPVLTDFGPEPSAPPGESPGEAAAPWGIHALALDYAPKKEYVEKGQSITAFEREGSCVVCHEDLPHGQGLVALCPNDACEGVGHLSCWSRHILHQEGERQAVIPILGHCPQCGGDVRWVDMMKELTLRERGAKEIEALRKKKRKRTKKT